MSKLKYELEVSKRVAAERRIDALEEHVQGLKRKLAASQFEVDAYKHKTAAEAQRRVERLHTILAELNDQVIDAERRDLAEQEHRIGRISTAWRASGMSDIWVAGAEVSRLNTALTENQRRHKVIEQQLQGLATPAGGSSGSKKGSSTADVSGASLGSLNRIANKAMLELQLHDIARERAELETSKRALAVKTAMLQRSLKRRNDEDNSSFRNQRYLKDRYLLMKLIGKGGFGEVWRAVDLREARVVAVKIHQIVERWTDERKDSYVRHTWRELDIQKNLQHRHIVRSLDVVELNDKCVASVLEYCDGTDLDRVLKQRGPLDEHEARGIIVQMLLAMLYLNKKCPGSDGEYLKETVIHYDLKPANILIDEHQEVRITDFGLSKLLQNQGDMTSMELTSPGAGTYWYLAPECLTRRGSPAPKINGKVDVWSTGVILFQMLYNRKPFGDGMSQAEILHRSLLSQSCEVVFPESPEVSEAAKDFIRQCLTVDVDKRASFEQLHAHPFVLQR